MSSIGTADWPVATRYKLRAREDNTVILPNGSVVPVTDARLSVEGDVIIYDDGLVASAAEPKQQRLLGQKERRKAARSDEGRSLSRWLLRGLARNPPSLDTKTPRNIFMIARTYMRQILARDHQVRAGLNAAFAALDKALRSGNLDGLRNGLEAVAAYADALSMALAADERPGDQAAEQDVDEKINGGDDDTPDRGESPDDTAAADEDEERAQQPAPGPAPAPAPAPVPVPAPAPAIAVVLPSFIPQAPTAPRWQLREWYAQFNRVLFDNLLPVDLPVRIATTERGSVSKTLGRTYIHWTPTGLEMQIILQEKFWMAAKETNYNRASTLVHEMCHAAVEILCYRCRDNETNYNLYKDRGFFPPDLSFVDYKILVHPNGAYNQYHGGHGLIWQWQTARINARREGWGIRSVSRRGSLQMTKKGTLPRLGRCPKCLAFTPMRYKRCMELDCGELELWDKPLRLVDPITGESNAPPDVEYFQPDFYTIVHTQNELAVARELAVHPHAFDDWN